MIIRFVLHCLENEHLLYEGAAQHCPPVPHVGDSVHYQGKTHRLEGTEYNFTKEFLTIHLLA